MLFGRINLYSKFRLIIQVAGPFLLDCISFNFDTTIGKKLLHTFGIHLQLNLDFFITVHWALVITRIFIQIGNVPRIVDLASHVDWTVARNPVQLEIPMTGLMG